MRHTYAGSVGGSGVTRSAVGDTIVATVVVATLFVCATSMLACHTLVDV